MAGKLTDLTGKKFGRLLVLGLLPRNEWRSKLAAEWQCQCDCGNKKNIRGRHLRDGLIRSCGCLLSEVSTRLRWKHGCAGKASGEKGLPEYRIWSAMKGRCNNPKDRSYFRYGGRGIKVCDRWQNSFAAFLEDVGRRPEGPQRLTIERVNNDGNYESGNCRWATYREQRLNQRGAHEARYRGKKKKI